MKCVVTQDNVYFVDSKNEIGFCVLYAEIYKHKQTGEIAYYTENYNDYEYVTELSVSELNELCESVKHDTNTATLDWNYVCGRVLLIVNECDLFKIQFIIQSLLDKGHRIYLNDSSQLTLKPGMKYSWETREIALLQNYYRFRNEQYWEVLKNTISTEWKNAERVRLDELKLFMLTEFPDENNNDQSLFWRDILINVANTDLNTLENTGNTENTNFSQLDSPNENNLQNNNNVDEEDGLCIICCENEAETLLDTCGHIVVCERCSRDLANSNNPELQNKCIYCKQNIQQITYIKSMKIVSFK